MPVPLVTPPFRVTSGQGLGLWYQATRLARASASCRYRMGHVGEVLRGAVTVSEPRPEVDTFRGLGVVVVVRPCLDEHGIELVRVLRRQGKRVIADFDDLLFAGRPEEFPRVHSGEMSLIEAESLLGQYRAGLGEFEGFTVSTVPLGEAIRQAVPDARVHVVPNGLSPLWVEQGRALYPAWEPSQPKLIRYLPGSPSHDRDFSVLAPSLASFMNEHPEVLLEVVGPLTFQAGDLPLKRISHTRPVPYAELPRLLASSWTTLAPLSDTLFAACKSANKFLESAAFGTPCVATPNAEMLRHVTGGVLLARGASDWVDALEALLDGGFREAVSQQGRAYVDEHGMAQHSVDALLEAVRSWGWGNALR